VPKAGIVRRPSAVDPHESSANPESGRQVCGVSWATARVDVSR
jgi:hypothetical protein